MAARRLISLLLLSAAALTAAQVPAPPKTACLARQSDPEVPEYEACSCPLLDEVSGFAPGVDYFEHKASSGNLQFWRIEYKQTYKVITNLRDAETYVLYLCSTPPPNATLFPTTAKFFQIPLQRVALADIGLLAFFTRLGLLPAIAHVPDTTDLAGGCGQRLVEMGRITAIDVFKPMNSTVDATFVTNDELMGRLIDGEPMIQPSSVIKVPVRLDPSPTARLEYIKFIAAFWNLEAMAETIFTAGVNQYECIANQIKSSVSKRPVIAWLRREDVGDNNGLFTTPEHPYRTALLLAAGVNAMIAQKPVNLADVQKGLFGADAIIDETDGSLTFVDFLEDYGLNASSLGGSTGYKFLDERKVFRVDKIKPTKNSLSSGFAELSLAAPDLALADLLAALYPSYHPGYTPRWLRNVALDEPILGNSPQQCETTAQVSAPGPIMPRDLCPAVPFPAGNPYGGSNGVSDAPTTTSPTAQPPRSPSSTLNIVAVTVGVTVGLVLLIVGGILVYGHRRYGWFKSRHLEDGNGKFVKMQDDFGARAAKLERGDSNSTL